MTLSDLEAFNRAIALIELNQKDEAHAILDQLRRDNPSNSRVLVCYAFTTPDLVEAQLALDIATMLEPASPPVRAAREWLEHRREEAPARWSTRPQHPARVGFTLPRFYQTIPDYSTMALAPAFGATSGPGRHALVPAAERGTGRLSWLQLSLVLILALAGLAIVLTILKSSSFTSYAEAESRYVRAVRQVNDKASLVNFRLQQLGMHGPLTTETRAEMLRQLELFGRLNQEFRAITSPSSRFEKLDSLLGLAYNFYGEGALLLGNGLQTGDPALIARGNQLLETGNTFLRQARDELKTLGLNPG